MIYRKLKVSLKEAKDRFYRLLLVREDIDLETLGVVLVTALGGEFEHMFLFHKGRKSYVDESWKDGFNDEVMKDTKLLDLGENFVFEYDTGDGWEFDCRLYKKAEMIDSDAYAFALDGRGQGIWEDHKWILMRYLSGELGPDIREEDEDRGIFFPWNYEIEKLSDFDECYDLEEQKEYLNEMIEGNLEMYRMNKEDHYLSFFGDADRSDDYDYEDLDNEDGDYEDDDYEDEDFYEEDDQLISNGGSDFNEFINQMVDYQIEYDPYVADSYKKLVERRGRYMARITLALMLTSQIIDLIRDNAISSLASYRKKMEETLSEKPKLDVEDDLKFY